MLYCAGKEKKDPRTKIEPIIYQFWKNCDQLLETLDVKSDSSFCVCEVRFLVVKYEAISIRSFESDPRRWGFCHLLESSHFESISRENWSKFFFYLFSLGLAFVRNSYYIFSFQIIYAVNHCRLGGKIIRKNKRNWMILFARRDKSIKMLRAFFVVQIWFLYRPWPL